MASRSEFRRILDRLRAGQEAQRVLTADGEIWYRRFRPKERLLLLGGGYIAQALCGLAADLDFAVSAADDRPEFASPIRFPRAERVLCAGYGAAVEALDIGSADYAAVLTRGHLFDADCLRAILRRPFPRYVGVIGSRGRAAALLKQLEAEGFPRSLLDRIHTPIGLDIHALTVPEIAVSIAAELISVRRADLDRRSKSSILPDEGAVLPVLAFLTAGGGDGSPPYGSGPAAGDSLSAADSLPAGGDSFRAEAGGSCAYVPRSDYGVPCAVLTVCETAGSTPVKPGAMMAVDAQGNTAGTIGGGSGEGELIAAALDLLRTRGAKPDREQNAGQDGEHRDIKRLVTVTMYSGPTEDGMACGGSMRVLIEIAEG